MRESGPSPQEMGLDKQEESKGEITEINKEVLMEVTATIPEGEKWNCETVMDCNITISDGAEMVIGEDGEMMDSKITIEEGGKFTNEGVDMNNTIENK